jgi:hypothetical protein
MRGHVKATSISMGGNTKTCSQTVTSARRNQLLKMRRSWLSKALSMSAKSKDSNCLWRDSSNGKNTTKPSKEMYK